MERVETLTSAFWQRTSDRDTVQDCRNPHVVTIYKQEVLGKFPGFLATFISSAQVARRDFSFSSAYQHTTCVPASLPCEIVRVMTQSYTPWAVLCKHDVKHVMWIK